MAILLDCKLHIHTWLFSDGGARQRIPILGGVLGEMMSNASFQAGICNDQACHF